MDILWDFASFVIALGILVTIHEYGHFWVARKLGVKVLTFSIGIGTPIYQKIGKDGVRYMIGALPLGGYVKMLDERDPEQEMSESDKKLAFNRQSVWARMAIVLAGPVANFALAIILYWIMFMMGIRGIVPEVGHVPESSIAWQAGLKQGDRIVAVDGEAIKVMHDLSKSIAKRMGEKGNLVFTVNRSEPIETKTITLNIDGWVVDDEKPEILHSLGIYHPLERKGIYVGNLAANGGAERAGIEVGDKIVEVEELAVESWSELAPLIQSKPDEKVLIKVLRNDELISFSVVIASTGRIGIGAGNYTVFRQAGVVESLGLAVDETIKMVALTVRMFKKLIVGEISPKSLSGPLSIAQGAGNSASIGFVYFISFLAMISVNLGFINLLPVPMLDGGHLLYFVIEAIKGKPLSEKIQEFGLQVGMMLVFALMATAIFYDISRF